ncbi:unnamed protein product [Effrenium voratum]|nr:unnamed protein product [Effrenium voratum]
MSPEQILHCERLVEPLLNPESPEFEYARTHGMQQLAMVNGFSLNKAEQRCGICGALGHLGFECPETNNQNYKMANVTCTICGDKGHVASDCKKAAEINKRENVDWKAMAEKKAQMDKDFNDMMNDMGGLGGQAQAGAQPSNQTMVPMDAAPGGQSNVDKTIVVPGHLVGKIIGPAGATIKKMAADTGAQINMDSVVQPGGGKAVVITAADPGARERAKAHVQGWIKENQGPAMPGYQPSGMGMGAPIGGMGGKGGPMGGGMGGKGLGGMPGPGMGGMGMGMPQGGMGMGGMGMGPGPMGGMGKGMGPPMGGMGKGMGPPMGMGPGMGGKGMGPGPGGCGMGMQNMPKSTGGLMPQQTGMRPGQMGMPLPGSY